MTEEQWRGCEDPDAMLGLLSATAGERRLRLFSAAAVRRHWGLLVEQDSRAAVERSEEVAEGRSPGSALAAAGQKAWDVLPGLPDRVGLVTAARAAARTVEQDALHAADWTKNEVRELEAELAMEGAGSDAEEDRLYWKGRANGCRQLAFVLRDIFNPFGTASPMLALLLGWHDGIVARLARSAYVSCLSPSGHLDPAHLGILADALLDAGCDDEGLIAHLRDPGPHWRGCHALDSVLGR